MFHRLRPLADNAAHLPAARVGLALPMAAWRRYSRSQRFSSRSGKQEPAIFTMDRTSCFPFGVPSNEPSLATFRELSWTVSDSACWAILSSSTAPGRAHLVDAIRAQARFHPPSSASHPILDVLPPIPRAARDGGPRAATVDDILQLVSFRTRLSSSGGEFDDYTARYYAIRDEDKLTVRQHLLASMPVQDEASIDLMAKQLQVDHLLDLPLVTLSNGQTRRARILRALLAKPELLILEEPFTGLDVSSRALLSSLMAQLHAARSPRVLLILRPQDELPGFITHVALVGSEPGSIELGPKEEVLERETAKAFIAAGVEERRLAGERKARREERARVTPVGAPIVELKNVNVAYGPRKVLEDVSWTVHEGERWVLSGQNGSGKSTLLSLILGDHPRSYVEDLTLFGKPRDKLATATLQENIGHVSPEILNAFPRKWDESGLTVEESIVTGFASIFSYRKITPAQSAAITSLLTSFAHPLLTPAFLGRLFASLSPGEQSLVLLLRALVKRPALLVLDEPFAGMDQPMVDAVKRFLDEKLEPHQAVVLISHFEEEVPESVGRSIRLEGGRVAEIV